MKLSTLMVLVVVGVVAIVGSYFIAVPEPKAEDLGITEHVEISNYAFQPANLTIKAGTTVVWVNRDLNPHALKSGKEFQSDNLRTGDRFAHTFRRAGTYDYICTIHPQMKGTVVVE